MSASTVAPETVIGVDDTFVPDAVCIRTTNANGRSHYNNDFAWPKEIGAIVLCPDWDPKPECGNGLHGLLDGQGDWSLLSSDPSALWWIVEVMRSECVEIDSDKVKFPRCRVKAFGTSGAPVREILAIHRNIVVRQVAEAVSAATESTATGTGQHASAAGYRGHASAAGESGHASAAGNYGHASAAGYRGHASAAGNYGHASVKGAQSIACALGIESRAMADVNGWIVCTHWARNTITRAWEILHVRAAKVGGEEGIKADTWYTLDVSAAFVEVTHAQ